MSFNPPPSETYAEDATVVQQPLVSSVLALLPPNFAEPVEVTRSWYTQVATSPVTGAEQRVAMLTRPYHKGRVNHAVWTADEVQFALAHMKRRTPTRALPVDPKQTFLQQQGYVAQPLLSEMAEVTGVSGLDLSVDTTTRQFPIGCRVALWKPDRSLISIGSTRAWLIAANVTAVTSTTVTVDSLAVTVEPGWCIAPMVDCLEVDEQDLEMTSAEILEGSLDFVEAVGNNNFPATMAYSGLSGIARILGGHPVFPFKWNAGGDSSLGMLRESSESSEGPSIVQLGLGGRAVIRTGFELLARNRSEAYKWVQYFDGVQGAFRAQWAPLPIALWTDFRVTAADFLVPARGDLETFKEHFQAIECEVNGVRNYYRISNVVALSATAWQVFPTDPVPQTTYDVIRPVILGRFETDDLSISWHSNEIATTKMSFVGVRDEDEYETSA